MPHTSRGKKKFERSKRQEVVAEDGWTRVVNSTAKGLGNLNLLSSSQTAKCDTAQTDNTITKTDIPPDATLKKLVERLSRLDEQWLGSESYEAAVATFFEHLEEEKKITKCIFLGSGTFCGYRSGWIGRHDVALLQLAVFLSQVEAIVKVQELKPLCYAQEPLYNSMDLEFLKQQGYEIEVLEHPAGLDMIDEATFVYAPGVERHIAHSIYKNNPGWVLSHHAAEYINGLDLGKPNEPGIYETVKVYLEAHNAVKLPDFEMANDPFHEQFFHYPKANI